MKKCTECGKDKNISEFYERKRGTGLYRGKCKTCEAVLRKERPEDPAKRAAIRKRFHEKNPLKARDYQLRALYNITFEQYSEMMALQGDSCKLCGLPDALFHKSLSVDHDHNCCPGKKSCGKCIRGLLCDSCNTALGLFKDDAELLKKAAIYIEDFSDRQP